MRKTMIASILSTDMARHFDMCHELDAQEPECASINWHSEADRQFIVNLITHSSDLSGQITPLHIAREWEERVTREFMAQSALELRFGFPLTSYFKDLHLERVRLKNHINFLDFVMTPLWTGLVELFPSVRECAENLVSNRKFFMDRMAELKDTAGEAGAGQGQGMGAPGAADMGVDDGHVVTIHEDRGRCPSIEEDSREGPDLYPRYGPRLSQSTNGGGGVHHSFASADSSATSSASSTRPQSGVGSRVGSVASSPAMSSRGSVATSTAASDPSSPMLQHSFLSPLAISINPVPEDDGGDEASQGGSERPSPSHWSFSSTSPSPSVGGHTGVQGVFASTAPGAVEGGGGGRKHESIKDRRESRWGDQLVTGPGGGTPGLGLSPASSTASLSPVSPPVSGPLLSPFSVGPGMNGGGAGGRRRG